MFNNLNLLAIKGRCKHIFLYNTFVHNAFPRSHFDIKIHLFPSTLSAQL